MPAQFRVLVVGGGIAGLTLGLLLKQRGVSIEIVEKSHSYGGVGYVLGLWPAGSDILKGLGLYDAFVEQADPFGVYQLANDAGDVLTTWQFDEIEKRFGAAYFVERARLVELLRNPQSSPVRMGMSVAALHQQEQVVEVTFTDGSQGAYDLVVGADGLHSVVRQLVWGDVPLRYLGSTGWAFWADPALVPAGNAVEYWGAGRFFGFYPSPGRLCCFIAAPTPRDTPDPPEQRLARIRRIFGSMGGLVPRALEALSDPENIWHDDFLDLTMPRWRQGRIVLLGDAAHAILPTAGVGASMAMESAAVLADELTRTDSGHLELALQRYEARRRPRVHSIQRQSRWLGKYAIVRSRALCAARNTFLRHLPTSSFTRFFDKLLTGPI